MFPSFIAFTRLSPCSLTPPPSPCGPQKRFLFYRDLWHLSERKTGRMYVSSMAHLWVQGVRRQCSEPGRSEVSNWSSRRRWGPSQLVRSWRYPGQPGGEHVPLFQLPPTSRRAVPPEPRGRWTRRVSTCLYSSYSPESPQAFSGML